MRRCLECAGGLMEGNGKCGHCNGTGINVQLDSPRPGCPHCNGSGICAACGGSGVTGSTENPMQTPFN